MDDPEPAGPDNQTVQYQGLAASDGLVFAPVVRLNMAGGEAPPRRKLAPGAIDAEVNRFHAGLEFTRAQIRELVVKTETSASSTEAGIFDSQLMMLDDSFFLESALKLIRTEHVNAEYAVYQVFSDTIAVMTRMGDAYMRERVADIEDVRTRLIASLEGDDRGRGALSFDRPCVIVADNITPSDAVSLPQQFIRGIATEHGSLTAHVSVLARALGVPAVVGIGRPLNAIANGDEVALDGFHGVLWHNPTPEVKNDLLAATMQQRAAQEHRKRLRDQPAVTPDGERITLMANTDHSVGFSRIADQGAEGIGLYRTEYLWIGMGREPTEEEQFHAYSEVLRSANGKPVTLRVLDIGGDKYMGNAREKGEANPFLGNRSIRYLLNNKAVFRRQVRAILRAALPEPNCRMMYPMISTFEELKESNDFVRECKAELAAQGIPHRTDVPTGIMIEVPSAVFIAQALAEEAHFFSIGTNDLVQYTFAVDRGNESVARLYQPMHPVILRMIQMTIDAAKKHRRRVSICGEMASDPLACLLLIGMGIRELSMSANLILRVKEMICRVALYDMQRLVDDIRRGNYASSEKVIEQCRAVLNRYAPDVMQ